MERPLLSTYTDYRQYLNDFFTHRRFETRQQLRPYTYSDFSAAADIRSPNYLKLIINGDRNLSPEMARKFSRALKLEKSEVAEFEALVEFNQAKEPLLRNNALKKLSEIRAQQALDAGDIDSETWEKVPGWLSWVIYALIDQANITFTLEHLKQILRGRASEKDIQSAIQKLVESGDVKIENNIPQKTGKVISNSDKVPAALVRKLQAELVYLGLESLYRDAPTEREISGFTIAMTDEEFTWVRHELRKIRKELQTKLMMAREKGPGKKVFQVNIQLFPLTNESSEKSESSGTDSKDI
ncbi:MAG: TIGR02147 family protein [Bdellovibrionaceae bacterium]|nr:TIGR02147 family protein [Pseudobdellovibrionaceae bacterium]